MGSLTSAFTIIGQFCIMSFGVKGGRMLMRVSAAKMRNTFHSLASKKNIHDMGTFSRATVLESKVQYLAGAGIFCFAKLSAEEAVESGETLPVIEAVEDVTETKATEEEAAQKLEDEKVAAENARMAAEEAKLVAEKAAQAEQARIAEETAARETLQKYSAAAVVIVSFLLLLK